MSDMEKLFCKHIVYILHSCFVTKCKKLSLHLSAYSTFLYPKNQHNYLFHVFLQYSILITIGAFSNTNLISLTIHTELIWHKAESLRYFVKYNLCF